MQCLPAFPNLHALVVGHAMDQVECQVQLQHHSTSLRTHLTDGRLNVEPPRRSYSLPYSLFRRPGRCQVTQHAARHRLVILAPIGDQSMVVLLGAHTACTQPPSLGAPGATPPLHRDVCNIRPFDIKYTPNFSPHRLSPSSQPIYYPSYTPTPMSLLLYANYLPLQYPSP